MILNYWQKVRSGIVLEKFNWPKKFTNIWMQMYIYMKAKIILEIRENTTYTNSKHRCYLFIIIWKHVWKNSKHQLWNSITFLQGQIQHSLSSMLISEYFDCFQKVIVHFNIYPFRNISYGIVKKDFFPGCEWYVVRKYKLSL